MRNRKGQALVEFVLILPAFLLLIFAFIDIGRIILCKNHLESVIGDVVVLLDNEKSIKEINNFLEKEEYDIGISVDNGTYRTISLNTELELITPGLKNIFDNPYKVKVVRSIFSNTINSSDEGETNNE